MATTQLLGPGLENFPTSFKKLIQDGILVREFNDALYGNLQHRDMYEEFYPNAALGQKFTFSNTGLLDDVDDPITPAANSDLDSGMAVVDPASIEQFTLKLNKYGNTIDTNLLTSSLSMENQFFKNAKDLGLNAGRSIDKAGRRHSYAAYGGGDTYATAVVTAAATLPAANVFGFDFTLVDGYPTAVSATNPLAIIIDPDGTPIAVNVEGISGVTVDKDIDWAPGNLLLDAPVTVAVGAQILSTFAPRKVSPLGMNKNIFDLTTTSDPTLDMVLEMVSQLEDDSVPPCSDMYYHILIDPIGYSKLMRTQEFREIFRGQGNEDVFTRGALGAYGNVLFRKTQLAPKGTRTLTGSNQVKLRHMIAYGAEMGFEGRYADINKLNQLAGINQSLIQQEFDDETWVLFQHRTPLDRHGEVVSSSWKFLGGFSVKTDFYTLKDRYYGRGIVGTFGSAK